MVAAGVYSLVSVELSSTMPAVLERDTSQGAHNAAIATLAAEFHCGTDAVHDCYDVELARLSANARITDFLVVLTSRVVRERLGHDRIATPTLARTSPARSEP